MQEDIKEILIAFLEQSKTKNLSAANYPPFYSGLNLHAGFGIGQPARISWITFLGKDQEPQNGIFPVYYLFKEHHRLVLAYGVSEKEPPSKRWAIPEGTKTIEKYFKQFGIKPYKYGLSHVFSAYDIRRDLNWEKMKTDLDTLLEKYKTQIDSNK
jgi:5-methylcytosine-specific restriction protein B